MPGPSALAALAGFLLAPALAAQITLVRGPAVCRVQPTSATVQWSTDVPATGQLAWGATPALGNLTPVAAAAMTHELALGGLTPASPVHYQVLADGLPLTSVLSFRSAPPALHPFVRIAAIGDSGVGMPGQTAVAALLSRLDPDLVLIAGDVNYPLGEAATIDANYFVPYAALLPRTPFYAALGNHDYYTGCGQPYLDSFCLPTSTAGGERYWSFDVGGVHIVCVDSIFADFFGPQCLTLPELLVQLAWLDADLAASTARWRVAFFHHAPWSYGLHGNNLIAQLFLGPILEARGVDLVVAGHDHCYQRFPHMVGGSPSPAGPRYLVVGTGGASLYPITPGPLLEYGTSTFGATLLEVSGNQLRIRFFSADPATFGQVLDDATMSKGPVTPTVELSAAAVPPGGSFAVAVNGEVGRSWFLALSLARGYREMPPHGVALVDLAGAVLVGSGVFGGTPAAIPFRVPPSPSLIGLRAWFQAAAGSGDPTVGGLWISNVVELAVR